MARHHCWKDFQLIRQLGTGSFGRVDLVLHTATRKHYAIKSVQLEKLNQKDRDNALNQIRLLASINNPYVIGFEGAFFDPLSQSLCMVLEYADGGDLQKSIYEKENQQDQKGLNQEFIWQIAYGIFRGLQTLHKHKIIHRDVKTANVFLCNGVAKLGDLNISKFIENGLCSTYTGTPYYTAPQIWNGESYGNKCDIWSAGVVIYELCALVPPFQAPNFPVLFARVTAGVYPDIPENYSPELKILIDSCLAIDQEIRPSASELLQMPGFKKFTQIPDSNKKQNYCQMLRTIYCPNALDDLNLRLPMSRKAKDQKKGQNEVQRKKIVQFKVKECPWNRTLKKARSEKNITWEQKSKKYLPPITSKKLIKFPGENLQKPSAGLRKEPGSKFKLLIQAKKIQSSKFITLSEKSS